ncbi:MAG: hypothetical protein J7M12_01225 [Candidatus Hydrogenedentes bacterium]|nr:hypothetical protein [Candidatus Hydrogenedentota bacterium]
MIYEMKLPDLGEDAGNEATVTYWHLDDGDHVEQDNDLVEMSTDKAVFTVPSPVTGTITEIITREGETVKVGDLMALIETE